MGINFATQLKENKYKSVPMFSPYNAGMGNFEKKEEIISRVHKLRKEIRGTRHILPAQSINAAWGVLSSGNGEQVILSEQFS